MREKKKLRFENGPEWEQYSKFKGQIIKIKVPPYTGNITEFRNGHDLMGELVWVDVYTLGLIFPGDSEVNIVYKGPGMIVSLA